MACIKSVFNKLNLNLHLKYAILPEILVNFNLKYTLVKQSREQMKFSESSTKIIIKKGMSHPLFVHIFMTESEITFCTNFFGQFCYLSFLNYSVKKKKNRTRGKPRRRFLNTERFRFTGCDKATPPKILIAVNNFFLPVIKFYKFYFDTKTPVF